MAGTIRWSANAPPAAPAGVVFHMRRVIRAIPHLQKRLVPGGNESALYLWDFLDRLQAILAITRLYAVSIVG